MESRRTRAGGFFIGTEATALEELSSRFQRKSGGIWEMFSSLPGRTGVSACYHWVCSQQNVT